MYIRRRKLQLTKILFVFSGDQFSLGASGEFSVQCVNFVESTLEVLISPITLTNTTSSSRGPEMRGEGMDDDVLQLDFPLNDITRQCTLTC